MKSYIKFIYQDLKCFNRGIIMSTTSLSFFSQDGLDTLFWGFALLLLGSILSIVGALASGAVLVLGAIIQLIGWLMCVMGVSALRKDYRVRVQTRGPSPPPPPTPATTPTCPTCGGPLTYSPQYQRWYCPVDQKYV